MSNYFFLATALPPLQLGATPEITFQEFRHLLRDNLSKSDFAKSLLIRRYYDIQNIRAFWLGKDYDRRGNLNPVQLEEALLSSGGLPDYIYDFMEENNTLEKRLNNFPGLIAVYFANETQQANGFLKEFLQFERQWRLVLAGIRAKQLSRDLSVELQYENPDDDFIAQILAQKDAKNFISPDGFEELQQLFEDYVDDPLELYQALCEYRFYKVEAMLGVDMFSIDRILGYMVQLIIAEKWDELDKRKGMAVVNRAMHSAE